MKASFNLHLKSLTATLKLRYSILLHQYERIISQFCYSQFYNDQLVSTTEQLVYQLVHKVKEKRINHEPISFEQRKNRKWNKQSVGRHGYCSMHNISRSSVSAGPATILVLSPSRPIGPATRDRLHEPPNEHWLDGTRVRIKALIKDREAAIFDEGQETKSALWKSTNQN